MSKNSVDVVLIGGGVMSATLGTLIKQVQPDWTIEVFESRGEVATESSNGWNNAGTGHAARDGGNPTRHLSSGGIPLGTPFCAEKTRPRSST